MNTFKDIPIDRVKRRIKKSPKNNIVKFGEINTSIYEEGIEQNIIDVPIIIEEDNLIKLFKMQMENGRHKSKLFVMKGKPLSL
jgi:hypothetical protein